MKPLNLYTLPNGNKAHFPHGEVVADLKRKKNETMSDLCIRAERARRNTPDFHKMSIVIGSASAQIYLSSEYLAKRG